MTATVLTESRHPGCYHRRRVRGFDRLPFARAVTVALSQTLRPAWCSASAPWSPASRRARRLPPAIPATASSRSTSPPGRGRGEERRLSASASPRRPMAAPSKCSIPPASRSACRGRRDLQQPDQVRDRGRRDRLSWSATSSISRSASSTNRHGIPGARSGRDRRQPGRLRHRDVPDHDRRLTKGKVTVTARAATVRLSDLEFKSGISAANKALRSSSCAPSASSPLSAPLPP
jgi:hypothetical protein